MKQIEYLRDLIQQRTDLKIKGHSFLSKELRRVNRAIKATQEGVRDVLTTNAAAFNQDSTHVVDRNNYKTYEKKVQGAYEMYNDSNDYGGELYGGVVDARVSFIIGEGLSIVSKNETTKEWLKKIIEDNRLDGSRIIDIVRTGELEGKNCLVIKKEKDFESGVKIRSFRWYDFKYKINADGLDKDVIKSITYKEGETEVELKVDFVLARIGGTWNDPNNTPSKSMKNLTDFENFSRAKYDFRKNNHLFGRTTPWVETEDENTAAAFREAVEAGQWVIGNGYAGPAKLTLKGPESDSSKVIIEEVRLMIRIISAMTGIPIHWLSWPDLMSNRATAENLMESVKASTQMERLIWEEAFEELLYNALIMSVDAGKAPNAAIDDFEVRLPFVSIAEIKAIVQALGNLVDKKYVSIETLQSRIPGIDPAIEKERLATQQKEKVQQQVAENAALGNNNQNNFQQNQNNP